MNRTGLPAILLASLIHVSLLAQVPEPEPAKAPSDPELARLLQDMRAAEAAVRSVHLELKTSGSYPGGLSFTTKGSMRVLRGDHPALQTSMEYSCEDGLQGRMETVKNADGVWMVEQSPTFGEVYLFMDRDTLADVEWAAAVMERSDSVPGATDGRSGAPLGSAMLDSLRRQYDLKITSKKDRQGQEGIWVAGDLKPGGPPAGDPDAPIADHVEMFVRGMDKAVLYVAHLLRGQVVQQIEVTRLEVGKPMELKSFQIEGRAQKPRDIHDHRPAWEPLARLLREAEDKAGADQRPSRKKGDKPK
ncbi:MAG TPA: hypothetical protein VK348_14930 [Planctomycetota bacterium]|nr:hypothetical protein [Planctomycetota bacterium]